VSIASQYAMEQSAVALQLSQFLPEKHLKDRERQYCTRALVAPEMIFLVRETEEGWWQESLDLGEKPKKQLDKLIADPTVACLWVNERRFQNNGGWELD
jgi:hypothetical protein